MVKKKKEEKWYKKDYGPGFFFFGIFLATMITGFFYIYEPEKEIYVECNGEYINSEYIIDMYLDSYDWEYIDEEIIDFYIDEKGISVFYWDKICRDLLTERLKPELSKSDNLWLDAYLNWFNEEDYEIFCNYRIIWGGENSPNYGGTIDSDKIFFNTGEILLAQEKRPLYFNESLVIVEYREEIDTTSIENDNSDFYVILKLKLNKSIEICQ